MRNGAGGKRGSVCFASQPAPAFSVVGAQTSFFWARVSLRQRRGFFIMYFAQHWWIKQLLEGVLFDSRSFGRGQGI